MTKHTIKAVEHKRPTSTSEQPQLSMPLAEPFSPTLYKMRTRSSNASKHPGRVVLDQIQRRRTTTEVANERTARAREHAELTMKREATLHWIAQLEAQQNVEVPGAIVTARGLTAKDLHRLTTKESGKFRFSNYVKEDDKDTYLFNQISTTQRPLAVALLSRPRSR